MDTKPPPPSTRPSSSFFSSPRNWLPEASSTPISIPKKANRKEKEKENEREKIGPLGLNTLFVPSCASANADLIFVHGLGGGSRKTWTKADDPSLYWPKEWLPNDETLQDVRIHSFGYDSNWGKSSTLGIHDFANALLNSIIDCPSIPRSTDTPLVLIGHSMGGLVIKRAYLLATAKNEFIALVPRIQGILFLATPHRGSDCAHVLSKLLNLMGGQRPYLADLNRDSEALHSINDEFPSCCQNLLLYSFYETIPTSFAVKKSMIVERDLATMGYANERRAYLHADHRGVCKYSDRNDSNYLTVRNAISSVVAILRDRFKSSKREVSKERRRQLSILLGVGDAPEDDFLTADSHWMEGSVEWLIRKENFQEWIYYTNSSIYSINAKPATGKTVLSGRVIAYLRQLKRRCSFYFFRYDTEAKADITSFLLSMAWQMADTDERIMETCLQIFERDNHLKSNHHTVWRKLFLEGIFKTSCEHVHYWVIDALDECRNEAEIISLLIQAAEVSSIHILTTSRNPFERRQRFKESKVTIISEQILEQDSKSDITMYLHANMDALPAVDVHRQQNIVRQILEKSRGCFLWVSLVVQELKRACTPPEKQKILDEVPTGMNDLYARILDTMASASYGKDLAKAILTWTACSTRPLKIPELHAALQLDLKVSIDDLESTIRSCCGQLVDVDKNGQVQMTHLTARQFLLNSSIDSEFAVNEKVGHRRLLLIILQHLTRGSLKGTRNWRSTVEDKSQDDSVFMNYASNAFCQHISHARSTDRDVLLKLVEFFKSPSVLHWIEYIAKHSDQQRLVEAGRSLGTFLQESPDQGPSTSADVALLSSWSTDLVRLVMQFGKNLEAHPGSIYHLIPPFCPSATSIRKQFGSSARGITIRGLRAETWDDCSTIPEMSELFSSLSCSKTQIAIGCFSGKILLFKQTTCQRIATLEHGEPVRMLAFGEVGNILVSVGSKHICVWDIESGTKTKVLDASQQCMALVLTDEDRLLLGALKNHQLNFWDLCTDDPPEAMEWTQGLEAMTIRVHRRPATAAFGIDCGLLAVIYKGQDILLWVIASAELHALYSRESGVIAESLGRPYGSSGVRCLVFGNGKNAHLLACAYTDGELVLFDTSTGEVRKRIVAFAHVLACSKDGFMLATADPSGTIQLFDLETLQLVYRIRSVEPGIQELTFSPDGLRLLDIRGSRCRVWDLLDVVKKDTREGFERSSDGPKHSNKIALGPSETAVLITSLACDDEGEVFFVGKEDGSVQVCSIATGLPTAELFTHAHGVSIVFLHYEGESNTLVSVDSSSRTMIHRLLRQDNSTTLSEVLFDYRANVAVVQVVCQPGLQHILICSAKSDMLWSIAPDCNSLLATTYYGDREPSRWSNHPQSRDRIILITNNKAHIYTWHTLERLTTERGIEMEGKVLPTLSIHSIAPCFDGTILATTFSDSNQPNAKSKLVLWSTADFTPESTSAVPVPSYCALSDDVEVLIGNTCAVSARSTYNSQRLVFLHGSQWVCAADIETAKSNLFVRHFFFPADWLSTSQDLNLSMKVTKHGDVLLVKGHEIAVVSRGLLTPESVEGGGGTLGPSTKVLALARRTRRTSTLGPPASPASRLL